MPIILEEKEINLTLNNYVGSRTLTLNFIVMYTKECIFLTEIYIMYLVA